MMYGAVPTESATLLSVTASASTIAPMVTPLHPSTIASIPSRSRMPLTTAITSPTRTASMNASAMRSVGWSEPSTKNV